jgi:AraC-like DNA-binding protein/DNA gyrase inhibitor GyrI
MAQPPTVMDPRTERAILLITTRFRYPLSLANLAADAGLSPYHLHRIFKSDTGQTPADYIARIRIEHAAHMMIVLPDAPLIQIAIESGFGSAATFARAFRRYFGQSASNYRRRKRLDVNRSGPKPVLSLQRLPARTLHVKRCKLDEEALSAGYSRLLRDCSKAWRTASGIAVLGIFVDAPFHLDRDICRHYLALEQDLRPDSANTLCLPGGLYVSLRVTGDIDDLARAIIRFKSEQLDPSSYAIASTLAFERTMVPNDFRDFEYRRYARDVFIKVRHKYEPAL